MTECSLLGGCHLFVGTFFLRLQGRWEPSRGTIRLRMWYGGAGRLINQSKGRRKVTGGPRGVQWERKLGEGQ